MGISCQHLSYVNTDQCKWKNPMHVLIREPVSPSLQMWQCWARKRELFVIVSHSVSFKVLVLKLSLPSWWHYEGPYKNAKWKRKWRRSAKQNEYVYVREGNRLWGSSQAQRPLFSLPNALLLVAIIFFLWWWKYFSISGLRTCMFSNYILYI